MGPSRHAGPRGAPPGRSFGVGSCLGTTFTVWARNAFPFVVLTAIVHAPVLAWTLASEPPDPHGGFDLSLQARTAATLALGSLSAGPITYGVVEHLRGTPAGFADCLRVGLGRLLPVLGVGVLVGVLVTVGLLLLAFPGLILLCTYWVAVPAAVLERRGIGGSLTRSARLTSGRRWSVLGVHLLLGLLLMVPLLVVWATLFPRELGDYGRPTRAGQVVDFLLSDVLQGSLAAVASAVGYHSLRRDKEGTSVEELARVFE